MIIMFWMKLFLIYIILNLSYTSTIGEKLGSDLLPNTDICGKQASDRIFGGEQARITEFPWMVLLKYNILDVEVFLCGGSLINNRYVLTAAHCVNEYLVSVRLGEQDLRTDPDCDDNTPGFEDCADSFKDVEIEDKIVYKDPSGDIALIRLKEEIHFTKFIAPICLPLTEELKNKDYTGSIATVAGWGKTENATQSDFKLKVEVPVVSLDSCSSLKQKYKISVPESHLCAGGQKGKDSCVRDSGGPLMYLHKTLDKENWYIIGVVSFGPDKCGTQDRPAVYTRVSSYSEWILSNLKL